METLDILKKIKALADCEGNENERENAIRKYYALMAKYGISESDLADDIKVRCQFKVGATNTKNDRFFVWLQTVCKALNLTGVKYYTKYMKNKKVRGVVEIDCTKAQQIEIEFLWDTYYKEFVKEKEKFKIAFTLKHGLCGPGENPEDNKILTATEKEDFVKMSMMMAGMDSVTLRKQIENSKPPEN